MAECDVKPYIVLYKDRDKRIRLWLLCVEGDKGWDRGDGEVGGRG